MTPEKEGNPKKLRPFLLRKAFIALVIAIAFIATLLCLSKTIASIDMLSILVGGAMVLCGYYHIVYDLPHKAETRSRLSDELFARISMQASRVSLLLVIIGFVVILIGILHSMGVIPSWESIRFVYYK